MRIIKNFGLHTDFSINCIAISCDEVFIAFGNSNKTITLFSFRSIENDLKKCTSLHISDNDRFIIYPIESEIYKVEMESHLDSVNALCFSKKIKYYLVSGSSDKSLIIWRINNDLSYKAIRVINTQSDITEIVILPSDDLMCVGSIDNNIYLYKSNFVTNMFELISTIKYHQNYVTSICLDPFVEKYLKNGSSNNSSFKHVSYADDGRLVLAETTIGQNNVNTSILKDYKEFINKKNIFSSIKKKIDWSNDGAWIASVNHHDIKNYKISHVKLINLNDLENPQILIGHDSAIFIAKFSKTVYSDKDGSIFNLLITADYGGNLIIWKIHNNTFKLLTEISNFSEASITDIVWSPLGDLLFISNTNGSVYIIEFNEFNNSSPEIFRKVVDENVNTNISNFESKRRISPILLENSKNNIPVLENDIIMTEPIVVKKEIEKKLICCKLEQFNDDIYLLWENKFYENSCQVTLQMEDQYIFSNKFEGKMIRIFACNNFFYAFYDTLNLINVYTLLNNIIFSNIFVENLNFIEVYTNYLLIISSDNKLTVFDVYKKEKIIDLYLNICHSKILSINFLDLDRIIICLATNNIDKSYYIYNKNLNILIHLDYNTEIESIIFNSIQKNKSTKSEYNNIFNDYTFQNYFLTKINEENDIMINNNRKLNYEAFCLQEKLYFNKDLNQKNEFIMFQKKFITFLIKNNFYYRLYDYLYYAIILNEKWLFSILEDKTNEILSVIFNNLLESEMSIEVKNYIRKTFNF